MQAYKIGDYIRKNREEKGISQKQLCSGICVHTTLSRIEMGRQEPSYYIVQALLQRLGISEEGVQILMGPQEFELAELQREIVVDNAGKRFLDALEKIHRLEQFPQAQTEPLIQQFLLRSRVLSGYVENGEHKKYDYQTQRQMLIQALELTCPEITMDNIGSFLLSENEAKIINQIAITHSEEGDRRQAIEIYRQLLKYVQDHFANTEVNERLLPLTAYNYSRLLGREQRYEEAIEIAELGRKSCVNSNKCQMLGSLLFNIACCLHELGDDEKCKELLIDAYHINKVMERPKSCKVVQEYAKETFGMEIL